MTFKRSALAALCLALLAPLAAEPIPSATGTLTPDSAYLLPAGGQVTLTASLAGYPGTTTAVGWELTLPSGWSYVSATGDQPGVTPQAGDTGTLGWAYLTIPESATFTYTLAYPASLSSNQTLSPSVIYTDGGVNRTVTPQAVTLQPATAPVITNTDPAAATYNSTLSFTINATSPIAITSYEATGLPAGLSLSGNTVSGTPTATGTFPVTLKATNAAGTGTKDVTLVVNQANATILLGGLAQTYNGSPKSVTTTTTPTGLPVTVTYDGDSTAPTAAGSYAVVATVATSNYTATASGTLTIAKAPQVITFPAVPATTPGGSVTLSASADSGLPVTFSVVSGSATLDGNTLTVQGVGSVVVRASQAGDANHLAAAVNQTVNSNKLSQTITFEAIGSKRGNDEPFALSASASSGLPVTFTLVSGPALLSGNTVTLTGAAGFVTVRADQAGNDTYSAAAAVSRTFEVLQVGPLVFFGSASTGDEIAANVRPDRSGGAIIGYFNGSQEGFVVTFTLSPEGFFSTTITTLVGGTTAASGERRPAADATTLTFTGQLVGNQLTGTVTERGQTFSATLEPPDGATRPMAGYYTSASLNTSTGTIYSVVGTNGKTYVLAVVPTAVGGSSGTIASDGTFALNLPSDIGITGNVNAIATTVSGTLTLPDGGQDDFSGLSTGTLRTDRLINLSTRAHVDSAHTGPLITGFVIGGTTTKQVLLRAVGPGLADYDVQAPLADPALTLFNAAGQELVSIDNWSGTTEEIAANTRTGAFPLSVGSKDALYVTTLAPGAYTMHVNGHGSAGIGLAEIYDAAENPNAEYQRLINISSRGRVVGGEGTLVGGFIVTGNSPKRVLVRGIGPGLEKLGLTTVLANPQLKLYNAQREVIATNDNWQTPSPINPSQVTATGEQIASTASQVGAFSLASGSTDASLIITLDPGLYTAEVSAPDNNTGDALIEIYEIPE